MCFLSSTDQSLHAGHKQCCVNVHLIYLVLCKYNVKSITTLAMDISQLFTHVPTWISRFQPWLDELERHKALVVSSLVLSPIVYYGTKIYLWKRRQQPIFDVLEQNFPGPKKHWLFGNLHEVCSSFFLDLMSKDVIVKSSN